MPPRPNRQGNAAPHNQNFNVVVQGRVLDLGSEAAMNKYMVLSTREISIQHFAPTSVVLCKIHIYEQVHVLFANLGWDGLLRIQYPTSTLLTWEFLATLSDLNLDGNFTFRCSGVRHHVTINHVCTMVDAPTDQT